MTTIPQVWRVADQKDHGVFIIGDIGKGDNAEIHEVAKISLPSRAAALRVAREIVKSHNAKHRK